MWYRFELETTKLRRSLYFFSAFLLLLNFFPMRNLFFHFLASEMFWTTRNRAVSKTTLYRNLKKIFAKQFFFNLHNKELTVTPVKRKQNTSHLTEESWHVFFEHIWTWWEDGKWSHAAPIVRSWNHAGCCRHDTWNVSC